LGVRSQEFERLDKGMAMKSAADNTSLSALGFRRKRSAEITPDHRKLSPGTSSPDAKQRANYRRYCKMAAVLGQKGNSGPMQKEECDEEDH